MPNNAQEAAEQPTYSAVALGVTPAATATDLMTLAGATGSIVRVSRVQVSGIATSAGELDVVLIKRTAANTGGTSTAPAIAQFDTNDGAPAGVVALYSANPAGLGAGKALRAGKLALPLAGVSAAPLVWDFGTRNGREVYVRAGELLAVNLNGATIPAGASVDIELEWTEVAS
jgi:hypothetical protein